MEPTTQPSDRDFLVALFGLVGALAEKLTGERPTVRVRFGDNTVNIVPGYDVSWESVAKAQSDSQPG